MLFLTSMNPRLLSLYGERFLDEFEEFADTELQLLNIFEGEVPSSIQNKYKKIKSKSLISAKHDDFLKKYKQFYQANGYKITHQLNNLTNQIDFSINMDYRFDAIRFSFKIFSIDYCLNFLSGQNFLIWTDADLRCLKKFKKSDLLSFMPEKDQLMSYLGRTFKPKNPPDAEPYSECGFLGFNLQHPSFINFIERMVEIYSTGELFTFKEWHDSWIWDRAREEFENKNIKFKNISGKFENSHHPFINTGLGKFFDHLKGPKRKLNGHSSKSDYHS